MPTPVSAFSPFTPACNAHGSGGYFDRPTQNIMGAASPFSRRPDLNNIHCSSSSSTRLSRVAAPIDSPRHPAENGWRVASRMREEAVNAWEQQVRGNTNPNNLTLLRAPQQLSGKLSPRYTQNLDDLTPDKRCPSTSESVKQTSSPCRPSLRLALHFQQAPSRFHSDTVIEKGAAPPKFQKPNSFFDSVSPCDDRTTHPPSISSDHKCM